MKKLIFFALVLSQMSCDQWSVEKQNEEDEEKIVKYLKEHTYVNGSIGSLDDDDYKGSEPLYKKAVRDKDGLYYYEIAKGGGISPDDNDKVLVHYTGRYVSGFVFDDSTENGYPSEFTLSSGVVPGWKNGLQKMKSGIKNKSDEKYKSTGKAILLIPSQQAYGRYGYRNIPKNAILIFEIELIRVTRKD